MDNNIYLPEFLEGKTIKSADIGIGWMKLYFTDGTNVTIEKRDNSKEFIYEINN